MSKICPHCQKVVEQDDRPFCPHCNYAFDINLRLAMQMRSMINQKPMTEEPKQQKKQVTLPLKGNTSSDDDDYRKLYRVTHHREPGIYFVLYIIIAVLVCIIGACVLFLMY